MTIQTTTNRFSYSGNGTTTAFAYSSKFLANGDLVVVEVDDTTGDETIKTITTHYTITGAGDANGGTVTMLTAPASGKTLVIYGDPVITQSVDLAEGDDLAVETQVEAPLDRLTLIAQRMRDLIRRSLRLPDGDTSGADMTLPAEVDRVSKYLAFDANGAPIAADPTDGAVTAASTIQYTPTTGALSGVAHTLQTFLDKIGNAGTALGAALVGYLQTGTGAVARTVQDRLREVISVKDFGAVGDGVTDDTVAIQAAIDHAESVAPSQVYLPAGVYKVTAGLVLDTGKVSFVGAGPYQTAIIGNFATGNILHAGQSSAVTRNLFIANLRIDSSVNKSAGAGLYLEKVVRSRVENVVLAGQDGEGNDTTDDHHLWDGLVLDKCDWVRWSGGEIRCANDGIRAWGAGTGSSDPRGSDIMLVDSKVTGAGVGLRCAGDIGGLCVDFMSFNNCDTAGVVIDQTEENSGNRQIFFGPNTVIDGESIASVRQQPGIVIDDAGLEDFFLDGVWLSVHTYGIHIQDASATVTRIHINGGRNGQCDNDAIRIDALVRLLQINGCDFMDCTGMAINSTVDFSNLGSGEGVLIGPTNRFRNNTDGDVSWDTIPPLPGMSFQVTLADDAFYSFKPRDFTTLGPTGYIAITHSDANRQLLAFYRATSGGATLTSISATSVTATTGALAGTTGVDGALTVSTHTDEKVYIENRLGASAAIVVHILGAWPQQTG